MKPTWRDYATILMAFAAVFLCGYGIGHLVGERRAAGHQSSSSGLTWEMKTLENLEKSLDLRPAQTARVEAELAHTAAAIRRSHDTAVLDYHHHIDQLFDRLIEFLDEEQAKHLRREKKTLERQIELLQGKYP